MKTPTKLSPERHTKIVRTVAAILEHGGNFGLRRSARGLCLGVRGKYKNMRRFPNTGPFWLACLEGSNLATAIREMQGKRCTILPAFVEAE